jgi:hypothetical protein
LDTKSDLTSEYIFDAELFKQKNYKAVQAHVTETNLLPVPLLNLNSGYILRAHHYQAKVIEHHGVSKIIS